MRIFRVIIAAIILLAGINYSTQAQQDSIVLSKIIDKSKELSESRPVERAYVHFDKPYYSVADTVWLKGYVTMEQNLPTQLSKIMYVEVINSRDSLVQTLKLPLVNGVAEGSIPLNQGTYRQGNYHFRAYTLWMLNFDHAHLFTRTIPVGEAIDKELITHFSYKNTQTDKSQLIDATLQFKSAENMPLPNKQVTWEVNSNFDVVSKGKGTTDQNGILKIKIDPRKNGPITDGELVTRLEIASDDILTKSFKLAPVKNEYDLQFFPEGGELISGIPLKVGFKAINAAGLGADIKGTVTDGGGATVLQIASSHLGMGSFMFTPEEGKSYKASVNFPDGSTKTYDLPKVVAAGATVQVDNTDPLTLQVKILANNTYFSVNKNKTLFLVGTHGGVICYAAKTKLNSQLISAKIPKETFPSGIMQITLFSESGQPISERLAFNNPSPQVKVELKTDLAAYRPRQKVKLSVTAKNGADPMDGNYSVSVTDDQKVPVDEDAEVTIYSSLLLTNDLKGYVEKPNYYFNKPDEKKLSDLDVLLLTQGYRRFNFKEALTAQFPPIAVLPEQDMRVTGTLRDRTGMPVRKGALRLTVTDSRISAETVTSPTGTFAFPNLVIPDSSEVVINAKYSAGGSSLMILLDGQPAAPAFKNLHPQTETINIDSALAPYLDNSKRKYSYLRTLKEVKIEGTKIKRPSHSDHPSLTSLGNINVTVVEGDRFKNFASIAQAMQNSLNGVTFFQNNFYVSRDYNAGSRIPMQIFLNGAPIDFTGLMAVLPEEVENVEIFLKDELGTIDRLYNTRGVLVVNTKKPVKGQKISVQDLRNMIPEANLLKFSPKGFARQREFYSPKYVNPANTYNFNDLRTTIYWNPKVITGAGGTSAMEYYNADGNGTYRVVIEGIDKNGQVSRSVHRYTVK
ncbi:carboxypeptidase regulatory-like domain-containing protein [Pedobacter faecalis]|uniref:carboxypeptidase regulatory-like domain-containing protein n=1 Tax=Pedobacter faecalis TaxID=3041495 RepID=UPI002550A853|nr:carboxypeptidase regulatory-like domain-containing protein [Pedobacter sp. ELA7]